MKSKRHTPEQVIRKLAEGDRDEGDRTKEPGDGTQSDQNGEVSTYRSGEKRRHGDSEADYEDPASTVTTRHGRSQQRPAEVAKGIGSVHRTSGPI